MSCDHGGEHPRFDIDCSLCPRLSGFLAEVRTQYPDYHARPVPPFGDDKPHMLIVGLAPGMHGANASGRPFTGDYAGILLYKTLFDLGFANQPVATAMEDGLVLTHCRITNAVKCLPPQNKPIGSEISTCNHYLAGELDAIPVGGVLFALGGIAHKAIVRALGLRQKDYLFGHAAEYALPDGRVLLDSYHCSRYNTNTGRLTKDMFVSVMNRAKELVDKDVKKSGKG